MGVPLFAPRGSQDEHTAACSEGTRQQSVGSSKPAGRSCPPLGWFDSIAAPWGPFRCQVRVRALKASWQLVIAIRLDRWSRASTAHGDDLWPTFPAASGECARSGQAKPNFLRQGSLAVAVVEVTGLQHVAHLDVEERGGL